MKQQIIIAAVAALSIFTSTGILAASQGILDSTSTGNVDVQLVIPDLVRISELADIDLGTYDGTTDGNLIGNTPACIFRNGAGNYSVTATVDGKASFILTSAGADTIAFAAYWNDELGNVDEAALTHGDALAAQSGTNTTATDCGGTNNANFKVQIAESAIEVKPKGTYEATVVLVITPI